jgi:hypothetical protein
MTRSKHKDAAVESLLQEAEGAKGCRVVDPGRGKAFKVFCPCAEKHYTFIHRTPSGSRYAKNKRAEFERWSCW